MATSEKEELLNLFAKYGKLGRGGLQFDQFLGFMHEGLNVHPINVNFLKQMKFLFNGIDSKHTGFVGPEDACNCVLAWKYGNHELVSKLIFSGADTSKSGKVSIDELSYGCEYLGKSLNQAQFMKECKSLFPFKNQLEFHEFYQVLTGKQVSERGGIESDSNKSSCYLLL